MLEEKRYEGEWWVPGTVVGSARGVLEFSPGRFALDLEGAIIDLPLPGPGTTLVRQVDAEEPIIHGVTFDGTKLTLIRSRATVSSHQDDFEAPPTWWPAMLVVGAHLEADCAYSEVRMRMDHLDEWAGTPGLIRDHAHDLGVTTSISVGAKREVLESADVDGLGHVEVLAAPTWTASRRKMELWLEACIRIEPELPLPLEEILDRANVVRRFVRTCVGAPVASVWLFVRPEAGSSLLEVLFRTTAFGGKPTQKLVGHQMLVARFELPDGLETALRTWTLVFLRHHQAWYRLCATDHLQLTNTDEAFIVYAKAIEALHAGDFGKTQTADDVTDERLKQALESLPTDLVGWAEPLLRQSRSPEARVRIQELVESLGSLGADLAGGDPESFALKVNATRNPLTHLRQKRSHNFIFDDEERYEFGRAMHYLGIAYILSKVGFSSTQLEVQFRRHPAVVSVIQRLAEYSSLRPRSGSPESDDR